MGIGDLEWTNCKIKLSVVGVAQSVVTRSDGFSKLGEFYEGLEFGVLVGDVKQLPIRLYLVL